MERGKKAQSKGTSANLGFEAILWAAADKYTSDSFEEYRHKLIAAKSRRANPEDSYEDRAENIFRAAREARRSHLQAYTKQPTIGNFINEAIEAMERENKSLEEVLPKDHALPVLREVRLGEFIDLIGTMGLGDKIVAGLAFPLLPGGGP